MSTTYTAGTNGVFPLPDWAKDDLSDLKGHQKDDLIDGTEGEEITSVYKEVRTELLTDQSDRGIDHIVEGQARWDDNIAHPLTVHDNVEARGIVRYYDNNNFYREPVVTGELDFDGDVAAELEAASETVDSLQAVLPGPYSLFDLATDEFYHDDWQFLASIAQFLAGEAGAFPDAVDSLVLLEPSLVVNPPTDREETIRRTIDEIASAVDIPITVHTYWGSMPEQTYGHLLDADIAAVGLDLVTDHEANLELVNEYGTTDSIRLGVVDGQNTLVESPAEIRERIEWFDEQTPVNDFEEIVATPNTELFYLPVSKYREKLTALGEAVSELEVPA